MSCETPYFCDKFRMISYGGYRSLIGSISTQNPHYQAVKSGFRRNFSREIPYATFLFRSAAQALVRETLGADRLADYAAEQRTVFVSRPNSAASRKRRLFACSPNSR